VLDSIRGAGGIASLKKVDRTQIRDRSAVNVGGGTGGGGGGDTGPHGSGLPPAGVAPGAGGGGMADALAAALQKRKEKVSRSGKSCLSIYLHFQRGCLELMVCR
jgi:Wiskott-Aldrich syndrome protein